MNYILTMIIKRELKVTEDGKVWRKVRNKWIPKVAVDGKIVIVRNGRHYECNVDELVYQIFRGQLRKGEKVYHKNGNLTDNRLVNLDKISKNGKKVKHINWFEYDDLKLRGYKDCEIAKMIGISPSTLSNKKRKRRV